MYTPTDKKIRVTHNVSKHKQRANKEIISYFIDRDVVEVERK